jgi:hypothetical protein
VDVDGQAVEILGRNRLIDELLRAGLEVAVPIRDRGIDLIAYADVDARVSNFVARPIQMKAASRRSFGVWKKYVKFPDMLLAFVWHLDGMESPRTYAVTVPEAIAIATAMGWTETASWKENGGYGTTQPSRKLMALLTPHEMVAQGWWSKVAGTAINGQDILRKVESPR